MYEKYLDKQKEEVEAFRRDENLRIPEDMDFYSVAMLSNEEREKLIKYKPATLGTLYAFKSVTDNIERHFLFVGQAIRISGITPAGVFALHAAIKKRQFQQNESTV